jgi:DNA-binding response OmpR family regulator
MSEKKWIALLSENTKLAETLRLNLEDEGYYVIQLAGVEEDLKKIKDKQVDLLILDLDATVWRMAFVKKAKRINPILAVVLLSSFEENLTQFIFSDIETAKTFVKPFELEEFSNSIKSILS